MEEYIQVSAKTKNEAITKAAIELGTASDELDIIVVSEGSSGFFGIGSKPAIIKARKKAEEIIEEESLKELEKEVVETVNPTVELKQEKVSKKPQVERPAREKNTKNTHKKEERQDIVKAEVKEKTGKEKIAKEKPIKEKPVKEKVVKEKPSRINKGNRKQSKKILR